MKPKIEVKNIWFDDDLTELKISVCDGSSTFSNTVYIAKDDVTELIKQLTRFGEQVHGGLYDIKFGAKGAEYSNGAFEAILHYHTPGKISISSFQQTEFFEFTKRLEASECKMFLSTEPSSLDNFVNELRSLENEIDSTATLICT